MLTQERNLSGLAVMNRELLAQGERIEWSWRELFTASVRRLGRSQRPGQ
jgi:hypothetical protein